MGWIYNRRAQKDLRQKLRTPLTKAENALWMRVRNGQLGYRCRRQFGVGRYVLDFYVPKFKLAIEVDGSIHLLPEQIAKDAHRQSEIEAIGIRFLRFTNSEVLGNMEGVLEAIRLRVPPPPAPPL